MRRVGFIALSLGCLLASTPAIAVHRTGIVERFTGSTTCLQGTHHIIDPCVPPHPLYLLSPSPLDELGPYECLHVDLDGPEVGVTCEGIVDPETITPTAPSCLPDSRELTLSSGFDTAIRWGRTVCAVSYDVIRGSIPAGPFDGTVGLVTCLADDVPQNTNFYPLIFGPTDSEVPEVGQVYVYLVRANGTPYGGDTYGRGSDGTVRVPFAGDCSF